MSKKVEATILSNGVVKILPAPPGFASLTSFRMKRVRAEDQTQNFKDLPGVSKHDPKQIENVALERCLKHRPWILFDGPVNHDVDNSDPKQSEKEKDFHTKTRLPKGVIRGCPDCSNCVNVKARWRPEDARKDVIEDAPVYFPTKEEFKDIVKYIAQIGKSAQKYGICRIVPPSLWNPPCAIQEKEIWGNSRFNASVQRIDGIHVPYSKSETDCSVEDVRVKKRRTSEKGFDSGCDNGHTASCGDTSPEFTVETFKKYADDFKGQYFGKREIRNANDSSAVFRGEWEPSIEIIEGEYKRVVDHPTEEIEVLCCDGLETGILGSGFPTNSKFKHHKIVNSCWNLNNVPKLSGSLISSECSRVLVPRVRLGMCFSTHYWTIEEQHLYALCYMHLGSPKIWYSIPPRGKQHDLVKLLSPSALTSKGIHVYRCVQKPREFVLVFPGVSHSGFDCGFNISETVNFAPLDWLPHGQKAVELYRNIGRKAPLSHDKLLLRAAFESVKAQWEFLFCRKDTSCDQYWKDAGGKEGILTKVFKLRVKCEEIERKFLCGSSMRMMDEKFDANGERECKICRCDLYFSAAGCPCSPDVYSCLNHSEQLCGSCAWRDKYFLFRHNIDDLNLLVHALEGNPHSIYKYAKEKLGLTLNSAPRKQHHPISVPYANALVQTSSIWEEIRARRLNSTTPKKTAAETSKAAEILAAMPVGSGRNLAACINKDPETRPSELSRILTRAEAMKKTAPVVGSADNKSRSLLQVNLAMGASTDSSSDESDSDPDFVIKL